MCATFSKDYMFFGCIQYINKVFVQPHIQTYVSVFLTDVMAVFVKF